MCCSSVLTEGELKWKWNGRYQRTHVIVLDDRIILTGILLHPFHFGVSGVCVPSGHYTCVCWFILMVHTGVTKKKQDTGFEYKRTIWAPTLGDIPSYSIEVSTEGEWDNMQSRVSGEDKCQVCEQYE